MGVHDGREYAIIAAAYKEYGLQSGCWFQLGFYSGMRSPGEMLGLQVGDIDLRTGKVKIQRIRLTNGQIQHCTKTRETRIHNLNSLSKAAIETLLSLPEVKNGHLFCHEDGEPVLSGKTFRKQLKALLKMLGIRERRMYDMRHTFATFGLMNGVNPAYLAKQLGHSIEEFFKTYSTWINQQLDDVQIKLLEEAISENANKCLFLEPKNSQVIDLKEKNWSGKRDSNSRPQPWQC